MIKMLSERVDLSAARRAKCYRPASIVFSSTIRPYVACQVARVGPRVMLYYAYEATMKPAVTRARGGRLF